MFGTTIYSLFTWNPCHMCLLVGVAVADHHTCTQSEYSGVSREELHCTKVAKSFMIDLEPLLHGSFNVDGFFSCDNPF